QADLEARVKRDMENARRRCLEVKERGQATSAAEERIKRAAGGQWASVRSDRNRLMRATKASKERQLDPEMLDDLYFERASQPAHSGGIANSGRDLRFQGRAVPTWRAGVSALH
ncbi:unnamed protein product, partial [Choristocarpus tenellus]